MKVGNRTRNCRFRTDTQGNSKNDSISGLKKYRSSGDKTVIQSVTLLFN